MELFFGYFIPICKIKIVLLRVDWHGHGLRLPGAGMSDYVRPGRRHFSNSKSSQNEFYLKFISFLVNWRFINPLTTRFLNFHFSWRWNSWEGTFSNQLNWLTGLEVLQNAITFQLLVCFWQTLNRKPSLENKKR